jgi:hypothetical protein
MMKRKLMNDLINQCQVITTACEMEIPGQAQTAIEQARKLLDRLEAVCGTVCKELTVEPKQRKKAS